MFDYPLVRQLLCFSVLALAPKSIDRVVNMRLEKASIFADRTSPALSAIQDALTLKDLEFELNQKKGINKSDTKVDKVNLKGMKISLKEVQKNIPIQELALRGEAIDVRHFSNKFINLEKNTGASSGLVVTVSTPNTKNETEAKKSESLNLASLPGTMLSAAVESGVKEKVLPSGVVVRVEEGDEEKNTTASASALVKAPTASGAIVASNNSAQIGALVSRAPVKLGGALRLNGGSFTRSGSFVYHIERKYKGKTYEAMSLRGDQKNYEIELLDQRGFLAVELRSPAGEILAYGEENLPKDGQKLLNLTLEPSAGLFSGQSLETENLQAEDQDTEEKFVADSKTIVAGVEGSLASDKEGFFGEAQMFSKSSEFLSATFKKDYWPTLSLTEAGKAHYPRLVKKSVIERLEADLDPFGEAVKVESLLLGKVTHKGVNRSGVKVEIFGQGYQQPIYFSNLGKPDPLLKHTSNHGGFVFTNLPDGGYLVQVLKGDQLLSQKWFVVRSGHISRGQIDLRERQEKLVFLESFPSHTREDKGLVVQELGTENPLEVNALSAELTGFEIESKTTPSITVLEVAENSYRGFRQFTILPSKATDTTLKRVNKSWLDSYLNRQRSNRNPSLGMIVGFISESNFELIKESTESLTEKSELYYFDQQGNPTATGVKGGGFVITNTKLGFQPLVVKLESDQSYLNKVVFTTSKAVSVF